MVGGFFAAAVTINVSAVSETKKKIKDIDMT